MLDLESPIISETKGLLELSSVGNLPAIPYDNWLKNWLLKTNQASVFYSLSQVSNNIRINSFTGGKAQHQTLIREIFQYDKPTHRIIKKNKTRRYFKRLLSLSIPHPDGCLSEWYLKPPAADIHSFSRQSIPEFHYLFRTFFPMLGLSITC